MPRYTADWLLAPEGLLHNAEVELTADGEVVAIRNEAGAGAIAYPGLLCAGFVNAHCHLELSHLRGLLPAGLGMAGFIENLQALRGQASRQEQLGALGLALLELHRSGTMAVVDIVNTDLSFNAKAAEPNLEVYTLVEAFGLNTAKAQEIFYQALNLAGDCTGLATTTTHAPYSTSQALLQLLYQAARQQQDPLSLHLLESLAERELFENRQGALWDLFNRWGLPFDTPARTVLEHILPGLPTKSPVLLVHLTELTQQEKAQLEASHSNLYYCLCPRSNLHLHGRLPDFSLFDFAGSRVCLGTDSLASAPSLELLEELKLLQAYHPQATTVQLLRCATRNGAAFMGLNTTLGELRPGTHPGLNLITHLDEDLHFTPHSRCRKLA